MIHSEKCINVSQNEKTEQSRVDKTFKQNGSNANYEITLSQYVDHNSELPIDPNIRFICIANAIL